jgi:hypothetical protein
MLIDRVLGLEPIDWAKRFKEDEDALRAAEIEARNKRVDPRKAGTRPAHTLADYVGVYEHPGYGMLEITPSGERARPLVFNYNGNRSPMEHFHFEVFKVPDDKTNDWEQTKLNFVTGLDGEVEAVETPLQPEVAPIRFARLPDKQLSDPTFLRKFAGTYAVGGIRAKIDLRSDGVLTFALPGQPTLPLRGVRGTRFAVEGREGTSVMFMLAADGSVPELAYLSTSGGNLIAKRVN